MGVLRVSREWFNVVRLIEAKAFSRASTSAQLSPFSPVDMADYIQFCRDERIFDHYPMDEEERIVLASWHDWGNTVRRRVNKDKDLSNGFRAFLLSMADLNDPRKNKNSRKGKFPFSREFTLFNTPEGSKAVKTWDALDGKRHTLVALETGEVSEPSSLEAPTNNSSIVILSRFISRW
jgi:hypothetical protein